MDRKKIHPQRRASKVAFGASRVMARFLQGRVSPETLARSYGCKPDDALHLAAALVAALSFGRNPPTPEQMGHVYMALAKMESGGDSFTFFNRLCRRTLTVQAGEARTPLEGPAPPPPLDPLAALVKAEETAEAARRLQAVEEVATPAQRRALERLERGERLRSKDRNALYHLRRKAAGL